MSRTSFNADWAVRPKTSIFEQLGRPVGTPEIVTLPHDALISQPRSPEGPGKTGYFPGAATFEYTKTFDVPAAWSEKVVWLEFQGAHRDAMVFVNDAFAAQRPFGYSTFRVRLDDFLVFGASNTVRVEVRAHDDSRWYTGVGITRDVVLIVTDPVHVVPEGLRAVTPDVDDERAVVEVAVPVENSRRHTATVRVSTRIVDAQGRVVAQDEAPLTLRPGETAPARHRLYVEAPRRWSVDEPYLYRVETTVAEGDAPLDDASAPLGIRTIRLDPKHGLRINDETVKLRGACIHHDNGPIGGAAIGRAEERRIELLKAAGFNAVRSAHNPISQRMLDACDRLGMLVMDEAFDMWTESKSSFDYSLSFPEWWERDVEAMVQKDANHPSVIFYSIGNEIPETGSPLGSAIGRRLAEKVREVDPTRFVTNGVNGFVSVLKDVIGMMQSRAAEAGNGGVNDAMGGAGAMMNQISASPLVSDATAESFSVLDAAGLNYGDGRYELDRELFPNRVLVGTETFPGHIDVNWRLVLDNPHVLGDFTWTGWDYLGEVGIGRTRYADQPPEFQAPYPWIAAWTGDIDITGGRRTISYYRETVFGLRPEPFLAVHRPENHGRAPLLGGWSWTDSLNTWTWDVPAGTPVTVDVYSDAETVELLLNGRSVGSASVGAERAFQASFELEYEPGELVAIARRGEHEQGRSTLVTARGDARLTIAADRPELQDTDADLAYVVIELRDGAGTLVPCADREVQVRVSGAGALAGLASARPDTEESFAATSATTFDGRLLAVVRPTGPGRIEVVAESDGLEPVGLHLEVGPKEPAPADLEEIAR